MEAQNPTSQSLNSSPAQEVTSSLNYDVKGEARLVEILVRKVDALEGKVHELETKKIIDETQLPPEILAENGLLPHKPIKLKRGMGYRPLLRSEIEEAIQHRITCRQQAKWLGVSLDTFRKYAKPLGLYKPNPKLKGTKMPHDPELGRYPLSRILKGEFNGHPSITDWMVRKKLLKAETFPPKCDVCGYDKRHLVTGRPFLLIDHKDGDRKNYKVENLRFLCLNCTVECGRGYLRRGLHMFDPDLPLNG